MWLFQFNVILMRRYFLLDKVISCFRDPESVSAECECEFPAHPIKYRVNCRTGSPLEQWRRLRFATPESLNLSPQK